MDQKTMNQWNYTNGKELQETYNNLDKNSIVFDIGGYLGTWSEEIIKKYDPYVYIFEPIENFYSKIVEKYKNNPKAKVFQLGLSNETKKIEMSIAEAASTSQRLLPNIETEEIQLKRISDFIQEQKIKHIHLMKINIEGDEFDLLNDLISTKNIDNIGNIQVQFHDFVPNAVQKRDDLSKTLELTHRKTWNMDFIWENWEVIFNTSNNTTNPENSEENLLKFTSTPPA